MKKGLAMIALCLTSVFFVSCGKSAADYNKTGMKFYESRDYDQAESYLSKAIKLKPDNKEYASNYGMILIQQGKIEEANAEFDKLVTAKSSAKDKKLGYRGLGMAAIQSKNYSQAIECFDNALAIKENESWNTDIKYYKANACALNGDTDTAINIYTEIIKADPRNQLAYTARANIYRDREEYALALADYNTVLLFDKGNFETYIGLAACNLESGNQAEAEEALFLASLLNIKTNEDKFYLGVIHYYQQKYDSAELEMEYALANGFKDAYFYLGEINLVNGDYEKAKENFDKYIENTTVQSPTVCNDLAVCLIQSGEYDKAKEWIEKGLSFTSSGVVRELKRNEIACLEGMGEIKEACDKLGEYVAAYPDDTAAKTEHDFLVARYSS